MENKQVQAHALKSMRILDAAEKPGTVVIELKTAKGAHFFSANRDTMVKMARTLAAKAETLPESDEKN